MIKRTNNFEMLFSVWDLSKVMKSSPSTIRKICVEYNQVIGNPRTVEFAKRYSEQQAYLIAQCYKNRDLLKPIAMMKLVQSGSFKVVL